MTGGPEPELTVVVPHALDWPSAAIMSVLQHTAFVRYEIVVVASKTPVQEGGPVPEITDQYASMAGENRSATLTSIRYEVRNEILPYVSAVNLGARMASPSSQFIAVIPGDMEALAKWNHPLMIALRCSPQWGFVNGVNVERRLDGRTTHSSGIVTCGMMATREAWTRVGGLDERYAAGKAYDDDDLYMKFLVHGYTPKFLAYATTQEYEGLLNISKRLHGARGEYEAFLRNQRTFHETWHTNGVATFRKAAFPLKLAEPRDVIRNHALSLGQRILDIGATNGDLLGPNAVNFDMDEYDAPNFVQGDANHLPFADNDFDVVLMSEVIEHLRDPLPVLREALRVAPIVALSVPNEGEYIIDPAMYPTPEQRAAMTEKWAREHRTKKVAEGPEHLFHLHRFTEQSLRELLEKVCKSVEIREMATPYYIGWLVTMRRDA